MKCTRRYFLRQIFSGIGFFLISPARLLFSAPEEKWINAGRAENIPEDTPVIVNKIILTRSGNKITAMSAICTHRGCTLKSSNDGVFRCPCHGARFDAQGDVVRGPATKPLAKYPAKVENGEILVNIG
jgi:cytochrome b6-f complex iron-sulfur subunit